MPALSGAGERVARLVWRAGLLGWPGVVPVVAVRSVVTAMAGIALVGCGGDTVGRAEPATWRLDGSFVPQASSTRVPILVIEAACSSGAPTTGRMEVDVDYARDVVTIDVRVTPLGGDQECVLVPTPYVVELREPLGDRLLVDANARTP